MNAARRALALALLLVPLTASAQSTPAKPPTLAESLARARPPDVGVTLAVGADKIPLSKDAVLPGTTPTITEVADAYGRLTRHFGNVTAVAPPTMAVLNTNPATDNVFAGMPSGQALKLLLATLSDGEWKALTGDRGLGLADLPGDTQRDLFLAALPPAPWRVVPQRLIGTEHHPGDDRDLTYERPQARLRLRQHLDMNLPAQGGERTIFVPEQAGAAGEQRYALLMHLQGEPTVAGIAVRAEAPNAPKRSQLDFNSPALQAPVPLGGVRTAGDLVARIGQTTRVELYADAHYAAKTLTVVGPAQSAPASELLRALALCLTGTYRNVGAAFVLTDDVAGVGTRRQILAEFAADVEARKQAALTKAHEALKGHRALFDLLPSAPDLTLSAAEQKRARESVIYRAVGWAYMKVPFRSLTAGQRQAIQGAEVKDDAGVPLQPDVSAEVTMTVQPRLEVLLPSLDGPISSDAPEDLFPSAKPEAGPPQAPPPAAADTPAPQPWATLVQIVPRRALLVHPRTAAEVDALFASAKTLGFNQLWVDVFSGGEAHQEPLTEALKSAKGTDIAVFAALDLLDWGPHASPADADLTILGETSAQAATRTWRRSVQVAREQGEPLPTPPDDVVAVSPFSPGVRQTLGDLVVRLSVLPGLAGLVWRGTDPPGYGRLPGDVYDTRPMLGYTPAARLAFLRREHTDPVDLPTSRILTFGTDTSLPNYDDDGLTDALEDKWRQFRTEANVSLLRSLYAATAPPRLRVLVRDRGDGSFDDKGWYGTWDGPDRPLPTFVDPWNSAGGKVSYAWDIETQARPESQVILTRLPVHGPLTVESVAPQVRATVQNIAQKKAWDGFVLDGDDATGTEHTAAK